MRNGRLREFEFWVSILCSTGWSGAHGDCGISRGREQRIRTAQRWTMATHEASLHLKSPTRKLDSI